MTSLVRTLNHIESGKRIQEITLTVEVSWSELGFTLKVEDIENLLQKNFRD